MTAAAFALRLSLHLCDFCPLANTQKYRRHPRTRARASTYAHERKHARTIGPGAWKRPALPGGRTRPVPAAIRALAQGGVGGGCERVEPSGSATVTPSWNPHTAPSGPGRTNAGGGPLRGLPSRVAAECGLGPSPGPQAPTGTFRGSLSPAAAALGAYQPEWPLDPQAAGAQ